MAAGMSIGSEEFAFTSDDNDWLEVDAIKFETITMNKEKKESRRDSQNLYQIERRTVGQAGALRRCRRRRVRRSGKAKTRSVVGKHRIAKEGWSIVATESLTVKSLPGIEADKPASYAQTARALQNLKQLDPAKAAGLKILRLSEVAGN
jgi:hypothetical protein